MIYWHGFYYFLEGKHIWESTSPFFTKTWNFYQAMALPDFNGDGVKEILVMHGGNPNIDATVRINSVYNLFRKLLQII
jgi:hypothetical protein